jgi:hypothetical protein
LSLDPAAVEEGSVVRTAAQFGNGDDSRAVEVQSSVIDLSRKEVVENG